MGKSIRKKYNAQRWKWEIIQIHEITEASVSVTKREVYFWILKTFPSSVRCPKGLYVLYFSRHCTVLKHLSNSQMFSSSCTNTALQFCVLLFITAAADTLLCSLACSVCCLCKWCGMAILSAARAGPTLQSKTSNLRIYVILVISY